MRNARPQYAFTSLDVRGPLNVDSTLYVSSTISCVEGMKVGGDLDVDGLITGSISAGGSNTQVQFNNAGVLDANAGLTYDSANEILRVRSHPTRYFTIGSNAAGASEILGYGNRPLSINSVENTIEIGDVNVAANGTCIVIDDPTTALSINCPNGTIFVESPTVTLTTGTVSLTGDTVNIATQKTPASATATGTKGDIVHDTNYIYVCTATDTWKRTAISTW